MKTLRMMNFEMTFEACPSFAFDYLGLGFASFLCSILGFYCCVRRCQQTIDNIHVKTLVLLKMYSLWNWMRIRSKISNIFSLQISVNKSVSTVLQ